MSDFPIADLFVWYFVFVFSTTFHEFAHAYLAYRGGDLTAYQAGHVSLDPVPHIKRSPFGMVLVPLLSFIGAGGNWMIGWASVPFDPVWGKRYPRRQAWMSLAGPAANLLLAVASFIVIRALLAADVFEVPPSVGMASIVTPAGDVPAGSLWTALAKTLSILLTLNVFLCFFNLLPVPPLDGAGVVEGFAPPAVVTLYDRMRESPMFQLLGLIVAWQLFGFIARPLFIGVVRLVLF